MIDSILDQYDFLKNMLLDIETLEEQARILNDGDLLNRLRQLKKEIEERIFSIENYLTEMAEAFNDLVAV